MFIGTQEIESVDGNIVTLKTGEQIEVTDKNKSLFTEEAITGSDIVEKWAKSVAQEIVDVLFENNVRLTDINMIINFVNDIISGKNDEAVAKAFGEEKLSVLSKIMGAEKSLPSLNVRNIRMKDIFNS
jgi:hypothetical protein